MNQIFLDQNINPPQELLLSISQHMKPEKLILM